MKVKKIVVVALLLMLATSAASATNWTTYLAGGNPLQYAVTLSLDVTYSAITQLYTYEYTLTNDAGLSGYADYYKKIDGFTIDFTGGEATGVVVDASTPTGWTFSWDFGQNTLNWDTANDADKLAPGASKLFRYTSPNWPATIVAASAQDGIGFSGVTVAPSVPEPISMLLGAMGLAAVGGFKRLRRK